MKIENDSEVVSLSVDDIRPFKGQPRRFFDEASLSELAGHIQKTGQIDHIVVRRLTPPVDNCHYELVKGERRLRAHRLAGLKTIHARIVKVKDEMEQFVISVSDLQSKSLSPVEVAFAIKKMDDYGYTRGETAVIFGKSTSWIHKYASLLSLDDEVLAMMCPPIPEEKIIPIGIACLLSAIRDKGEQKELARTISSHELSLRDAKRLIDKIQSEKHADKKSQEAKGKDQAARRIGLNIASLMRFVNQTSESTEAMIHQDERKLRSIFLSASPETQTKLVETLDQSIKRLLAIKAKLANMNQ